MVVRSLEKLLAILQSQMWTLLLTRWENVKFNPIFTLPFLFEQDVFSLTCLSHSQ